MCVCVRACSPMHKVYMRMEKSNKGYTPACALRDRVEREIGESKKGKGQQRK